MMRIKQLFHVHRHIIAGLLLCSAMIAMIGSRAVANDFTDWQKRPDQLRTASVTQETATLQSAEWEYLVAPGNVTNIEVSANVTIETPASQFDFFGSSWSAWPDPKYGDRGFDASIILRSSEDGSSGYRVQLSSKYQEVALVRFPDGGYLRSIPCVIKTQAPIRVHVKAAGSLIRVSIDDKEIIQYEDRLEPQIRSGRMGIGASSLARCKWSDFSAREVDAEATPAPTEHRLQLSYRRWLGGRLFVFDNNEPILQLHHEQDPSMFAKLRPGLRPLLTFDSHWGLENQGAYKEASATWTEPEVSGGGDAVTAKWSAIHVQKRFTTQSVLKVGYDTVRNCYTYDIGSELEMLPGEAFQFRYGFDFEHHTPLDPFRWQYLLIRDGDGRISYRPLSPFDPGTLDNIQSYHGLRVWHGRTGDLHQVSPAVEYEIQPEWIQYQDDTGTVTTRRLNTAVCAAFYDTGVSFNAVTARPGDKIRVQYRYTGYPAEETNELFKTATVQNNPRIDPKQHFVFLRDQWPTIRFDDALAMDKPWWGGRPMMSGHNARPAYDYVQEGGQGMLRLGPVSYAAAALGPEKLEPGPYLVSARVKSVNTHGPGGRLELLMLKKGDLNGNSFIRWDVGNIVSEQTRYFGRGSFDWRDVSFVAEVPKEATGLALGLGNSGTGEVFVSEVRIEPLGNRQSPPEMLSATPPSDDVVHDALWDLRMEEHKGLHIFNHGSSTYRTMELANVDWVTDEGHSAIRFSENPPERRDFPLLGILDQNLRNPAQRQNYEAVCHGAFALGGHHGGGEKLNGLTLAAWIKPAAEMGKSTSYSGKGDILGYGARRFILGLQGQAAPYSLIARINVNDTIDSSKKLDADRWYHVAMTCTPSDENWQVRLYLDGQEVGASVTKSLPASSTIPDSLVLGAELFYLHGAYYRGLMSRVLVVTRTMDGDEIRSLMNSRALRETRADEFTPEQLELFEKEIRPLLIEHCLKCHGPDKQEGGLNLATRERIFQGGDSGAAMVADKPAESLLITAVEYLSDPKMPPSGKLPAEKIAHLRRWVASGAAWPKDSPLSDSTATTRSFEISENQKQWWAFQPLRDHDPPEIQMHPWIRNDLDRFVLAALEDAGLAPAPEAERIVWLRRATFDLTGLPPSPEEIHAFLEDKSEHAFESVVERLLDSPAYGQRFARHWLDIVRYADYHDFNPAARVASCEITEAWRYRDWVVDALNRDLPFDQFIVHQIAGDQLPSPTGDDVYPEGLIATTFLSNGVWDRGDADKEKIVSDMVDDNIGVIGKAFLGLTLECARCHDHKFDPISTEDYYGLAGMFYSSHILKELGAKGGEYNVNRVPLLGPQAMAKRAEQERRLSEVAAELTQLEQQHRYKELLQGGQALVPTTFQSEVGAIAKIADDSSITVSGTNAKDKTIVETVVPEGLRARYLRLEALPDATLPASGSGRASDGNFVVSRLSASFIMPGQQTEPTAIQFVSAQADFEQANFPAKSALDDDLKDGWAVSPQTGKAHVAVFEVAPQTAIPAGSKLRVIIEQQHSDQHTLGKFRLSVAETMTISPPLDTPQRQELVTARDTLQKELAVPVPLAMAVSEGGTPGGLFPGIQDVPIHIRGSYTKLGAVVPRRLPKFLAGMDQQPITQGSGRKELAAWIASPTNPLTARVIVNRVWQWHFGEGLVRTPSNFGMLSEPPTNPEMLDWLAMRFVEDGWSLKKLHRRIMLSATYRQSSRVSRDVFDRDPENRLLGRFTPRRLEAESIRDAILSVSGQLEQTAGGPAGDDFTIRRRSLFVQTARWQRDSYANLFDAANPDSSTEKRVTSTVAPQALLLLNHPWMQDQSRHLADRLISEIPEGDATRIERAYQLLFGRKPNDTELKVAQSIVQGATAAAATEGWIDLAHVLLCSNEFIYVD